MKSIFLILLLPLFFSLTGCGNLFYLSKLGWHQSFIIFQSAPVHKVLEEDGLGAEDKEKILFIQEVKRYGEEKLGLRRTGSYTRFFEAKRPVLYLITASKKDRLELHQWAFPIIGTVTYKSFFTLEAALKERRRLERKDYDTYLQQAAAYSTLGWLKDPIFSTMLQWDAPTLAGVILHELVHATVYFKGEIDLNEQMATFIGNRGAIDFLTEKYGSGSKEAALAIGYWEDALLFGSWIGEAHNRLSAFYAQPVSREEKLRGREEIFGSIQENFAETQKKFKTGSPRDIGQKRLNNAVLMAYRRYYHRLDRWENLYEAMGRDLRKVVQFLKKFKTSGELKAFTSFLE